MISSLPTYLYQGNKQPTKCPHKDQDEPHASDTEARDFGSDEKLQKDFNTHSCSICIDSFEDDESIKILPCFHQFHTKCVDDWLLRKSICPVCKFDIDSNEDYAQEVAP